METNELLNQVKDAFEKKQAAKQMSMQHNMMIAETDEEKQLAKTYYKQANQAENEYNDIYGQFSESLDAMPDGDDKVSIAKEAIKYVSY